jgi:hypothetical protein
MDEDSQAIGVASGLRAAGMEVHRSANHGNDGISDEGQVAFASSRGWVMYTANTGDFLRIHAEMIRDSRTHSGIILRTRQESSIGEQIRRVTRIWQSLSAEDMLNRYESISQWGSDHPER